MSTYLHSTGVGTVVIGMIHHLDGQPQDFLLNLLKEPVLIAGDLETLKARRDLYTNHAEICAI